MAMEDDLSAEESLRRLGSWNAWKDLCWIHGLGKRLADGRVIGTPEDEAYLAACVKSAFLRKLKNYRPLLSGENGCSALSDLDCAQEFDAALNEYENLTLYDQHHWGEAVHERKRKAWKDFVWQAVGQSDDPPLKVIRGKLLGRQGVINRIVEEWILKNYSGHFETDHETGKQVLKLDDYVDGKKNDSLEGEKNLSETQREDLERRAESVRQRDDLAKEDNEMNAAGGAEKTEDKMVEEAPTAGIGLPREWVLALEEAFPPRQCCVIFAHINGVKIYAPEFLDALGCSNGTAYEDLGKRAQDAYKGLPEELRMGIAADDVVLRAFKAWIKSKIVVEKAGRLILSKMAERVD